MPEVVIRSILSSSDSMAKRMVLGALGLTPDGEPNTQEDRDQALAWLEREAQPPMLMDEMPF